MRCWGVSPSYLSAATLGAVAIFGSTLVVAIHDLGLELRDHWRRKPTYCKSQTARSSVRRRPCLARPCWQFLPSPRMTETAQRQSTSCLLLTALYSGREMIRLSQQH